MHVVVPGERLGDTPDLEDIDEDIKITNPVLRIETNQRTPSGFIVSIEEGEAVCSIRITTERMKMILKHAIDVL